MVRDPGARESFAAELVDPHLPLDLADLLGDHQAELGPQDVLPGAPVVRDRRLGVRLALAAAAADHAGLDAVQPLVAEHFEARARMWFGLRELRGELGVGQPGQDLRAVLRRLLPDRLAGHRVPAAAAIGRFAAAPRRGVGSGRALGLMRDVDARPFGAAPRLHRLKRTRKVDTKVDTNAAQKGPAAVR